MLRFSNLAFATALTAAGIGFGATQVSAQTLRIAMTASDTPTVGGIPDNGGEGQRFTGFPVYDGLVNWDFGNTDRPADLTAGLATEWHADPQEPRKWIFKLRKGVKFHDGTDFTADAAIWTFDRIFNAQASNYDTAQSSIVRGLLPMLEKYEKLDDDTIAIWTKKPFSPFPYLLTRVLFVSPTQFAKVGGKWVDFNKQPAGTGAFKVTKVTQRVSIELARNENYWDKARVPKVEKIVLLPMPEATTRLAALRSGQVDWIEAPPPDAIPSLKSAGFQISLKPYPHIWPWALSVADNSPFKDKRVRQAVNYAIDREGLVTLLNGTAKPAAGFYDPSYAAYGKPTVKYTYDPAKAKALLAEAGYGPDKPLKFKVMISTAGSGQMLPIPMNEFLQQNLKQVGVDVEFNVVDWATMLVANRNAANSTRSQDSQAMNISQGLTEPTNVYRLFHSASIAPNGLNWGMVNDPVVDKALDEAFNTFDPAKRDEMIGVAHAQIVDEAYWLFVVNDLNPRAMTSKVSGFKPAQSWYQDLTQVTVVK